MESRTLLSTMDFTNLAGGLWGVAANWVNVANSNDHHVPNISDDAVVNVPGNVTVTYQGSQPTVLTLQNDDTIWVNGSSAGGNAVLSVSQGITNDGTILMQSSNAGYSETISTGSGTFTNNADGTIHAGTGSGGARTITGTLVNQGQVVADSNQLLVFTGNYNAAGGTITGPGYLYNSSISITASTPSPTTILIGGTGDTLATNVLPNTTLWVQANDTWGNATLNVANGLTNDGTILLQSANVYNSYTDKLALSGTFINDSDGTIHAGTGSGGARTMTGTLVNQGQVVADSNQLLVFTGNYNAAGGTIAGPGYLYNSSISITASTPSPTTILIGGTGDTLATNVLPNTTLWVQANDTWGNATLNVTNGLTNDGTILLQSANVYNSYTDTLATGTGTFTNAADGSIHAGAGGGGARTISGTLINQGQIVADGNQLLVIAATYYAAGGTIAGPGYLYNAFLYVTASPVSPTTILIGGTGDTLESGVLPNTTLWVQANDTWGNATLTVPNGLTNDGTILLQSSNVYNSYTDKLVLSGTFTNDAVGTIHAGAGTGGTRTITGTLANQGQVAVDAQSNLGVVGTLVNTGQINAGSGSYMNVTGSYYAGGGSNSGPVYLYNTTLYVTASPSTPTTIIVEGTGDTLATNVLPNTTLWVQANDILGNATLNVPNGLTNDGTILLQSANVYNSYTDKLALSGTFTNAADGTIQASAGSGGARTITGTLVNQGKIVADSNQLLVFTGNYNAAGGTIAGPGYLYNTTLYITASTPTPTTVLIGGTGDTLATNVLPNTTLWVQANDTWGNATLTVPNGLTNDGTILLQSANVYNSYTDTLALSGTFTNAADGTIHAGAGSGGARTITGKLVNQGLIVADSNQLLVIPATYYAAGGTIAGPGYLYNTTLYITASTPTPTTILIGGTGDTLATNVLPNTTLWVQANDTWGNATLNVPNGLTNDGTVLLQSSNVYNSYTDKLALSGTFTNAPDGTIHAATGSGGARTITGTLVNQGQIAAAGNQLLVFTGTYYAAGGSIAGPGYIYNSKLYVTASPSGGTTILLGGTGDTLKSNVLSGTTLWVQANDTWGNATLTVPNGLTNDGTILLQSANVYNSYTDTLTTGTGTFTNAADGTIHAGTGSGGARTITGTLVNQGQIVADSNQLLVFTGNYNAAGGTITGPGYLYNSSISITASTPTPTTILIGGTGDTLATNILPNTTLWVQANDTWGNATLTVPDGLTNDGTILLQSANVYNSYTDKLALSGTFTNAAAGTIDAGTGSGGGRSIVVSAATTLTGNLLTNPGAETGNLNGWTVGGSSNPRVDSGSFDPGINPHSGTYDFLGGTGASGTLTQNVPLVGTQGITAAAIDAGTLIANVGFWEQGLNQGTPSDDAQVTLTFRAASGTVVSTASTPEVDSHNGSWQQYDGSFAIPVSTRSIDYTIQFIRHFGNDLDAFVDDTSLTVGSGAVVNAGTINLDTNTTLGSTGANQVNTGLISIAGATVTVVGSSFGNETGGLISGYGTFNTSGLTLTNNGIIDLSPPSILGVQMTPSAVAITYYDTVAMNATTVTNPANYTLLGSGGDGIFGNGNDVNESGLISQVTYNASTKTVTLQLSSDLPVDFYRVEVNGSAVQDTSGTALLAGKEDLVNRVLGLVPATVSVALDPASDSGASNHDGITNVTNPTFDVQVNQAGTIGIDFDGNGTIDATMSVQVGGTYQLTAPTLANGTYSAAATFISALGGTSQSSTTYTIDTVGPHVASMSPNGTIGTSISEVAVTFNELVDLNTFTPSAITLTGSGGVIAVAQPQPVSGSTYDIGFATQTAQGGYTLTIAPSVADLAGNKMDQNQNGINGEPGDSFTGSFTIGLPDLAVTATQAPSSAVLGAIIPVSWTVTNVSPTNPAPSMWTDAVYVSPDSVLDGTAIRLISVGAPDQPPLNPGASYTRNESITIPGNLSAGSDFLLFVANDNGGQLETDAGNDTNDLVAVPITLLPPAQASVSLDPASDSGAPDHPGFTNVTAPTFDVLVNQAGTITVDFDGNAAHDQTLAVAAGGTYKFTAPILANGSYTAAATFNAGLAGVVNTSFNYTIDTVGAHVTSVSPTGTIGISASEVTVTFNEPVDLNSFIPSVITFTGPGGPIAVNQPQLVSGTTYSISFATQAASGGYTLTIAPTVTDFAGNELDQNQNGINGELTDSFTGSFTENLPVGGPITLNTPTLGFVPPNYVDDWTFFGRAGQTITTVVATSAAQNGLPPPPLNFAQLTLEDSNGNVLGTASNIQSGAAATLADITLPGDGVYTLEIQATAGQPGVTGFYDLTVADATVHQIPLTVNQPETGQLEDQYSTDQWVFSAMANQQVKFDLLAAASPNIAFDLTGPNGYTAFSGLTTSSGAIDLPTSGNYTVTVHTTGLPGGYGFELEQASQIALTLNTPYQMALAGSGQSQLFNVTLGAGNPLEINLTDPNAQDQNEVYVSYGKPPTRNSYDYRYTGGAAADHTVVLTAKPGTYYILVYNNLVKSTGTYTIEAESAPFLLSGMNPTTIGNAGDTTVQLSGVFPLGTGGGGYVLETAPTLQLIDHNGMVVPGVSAVLKPPPFGSVGGLSGGVSPDGTMIVSAVIPGGMVLPGIYSVRVTDNSGYSQTLTNILTVVQGGLGILKTNVIVPNPIGYHVASTIYVQYTNIGDAPLQAPLLVLSATQNGVAGALMTLDSSKIVSGFWTSATPDGYSQSVQFLASGAIPGILQPGESMTVPVYYAGWLTGQWDFSRPPIDFTLGVLDNTSTQTTNWASLQNSLKPATVSQTAWNALYPNLTGELGPTWGSYVQRLDTDAQYLAGLGENVTDIGQLFSFEVQQANGYSPMSSLASSTDAQVASPGLPLSFARTFTPGIIARNHFGRFGWGWSDSWDTSLTVDSDGSVNVLGPDGSLRRFQPDSRGGYFDQPGDHGTLEALPGGGYNLTELSGAATTYNANGTLNYVQDTNGNRITAGYTGGLLTKLTHSSGQSLTLQYNAAGLVSSVTDSAGRTTTYAYDPTNQYLTREAGFDGKVTSYTYDTGANPVTAHALLSVNYPSGSHQYYTYDPEGRLSDDQRDGGVQDQSYSYNEGQVRVADIFGDTTKYSYDARGLEVQVQGPLGNTAFYAYDTNGNLIQATDAAGQTYRYTYDNYGDVLTSTDPLGRTVTNTYDCADDRLASTTNANGNTTTFVYDGNGNLTTKTYADGTIESLAYDPIGNVVSSINGSGQVTGYTRDAAGNLLTETFADGSETVFTYDAHENLTSASNANGTTTLSYDANDRLTRISYPGGLYLTYSYDSAGRRARMTDQSGYAVTYGYDAVGDLASLTDGSGALIVRYTYNSLGQLSREDRGNGTYVTYAYDAASELLHLVNYAADGSVDSRFDDTYDNLGRVQSETTLDGTWGYTYDAVGELIHAVFASTNPAVPSQDLAYSYDAAGNRTQTVINGVKTVYTSNARNEYTSVGGVPYTYNADGDLVSNGVTTNTYDLAGHLIGVAGPTGTTTYTYDGLGNRLSSTAGGQVERYLIDALGGDNLVGVFDGQGGLVAHYTYGIGLASQATPAGMNYYEFTPGNSTAGLTNALGSLFQSYVYAPFGNTIATPVSSPQASSNPFTYGGRAGFTDPIGETFGTQVGTYNSETGTVDDHSFAELLGQYEDDFALANGIAGTILAFAKENLPGLETPMLDHWLGGLGLINDVNSLYNDVTSLGTGPNALTSLYFDTSSFFVDTISYGAGALSVAANTLADQAEALSVRAALASDLDFAISATGFARSAALLSETAGSLASGGALVGLALGLYKLEYNYLQEHGMDIANAILDDVDSIEKALESGLSRILDNLADLIADVVNSIDPNDKFGPAGFGPQAFVSPANPFPYHIDFENSPTASAPAQRVDITDQLDPNLDWSTFQWTGFGFGDNTISIPADSQHYETTLPMTYNGVTFRVIVTLDLNPLTGMLHASFQSLNAANLMTGLADCPGTLSLGPPDPFADLPPDVTIGFLPPEDGTGRGMGYLTYTVQPKSDLGTGTQIRNVADVTFDLGTTIATDQVSETDPTLGVDPTKQDLVTIDAVAPTSSVAALPPVENTSSLTVTWSGQDDPGGSGVATYDIYASDNGAPFVPWLSDTTATSASYVGLDGHTYGFFSVATDNAGNQETIKTAAEATTTIDVSPPTSAVAALPTFSPGSFTLAWSGSDANGVGIASYDVYVSDNGGAFSPLLTGTTTTSTTFSGSNGHTYGFYSVATDNLGNRQPAQGSAQARTTVDSAAPTSTVAALPPFSSTSFTINWSGSDDPGGSGLASYSVYVSDNEGAFAPLMIDTTQTSTNFMGVDGHRYGFYSVATDNVGNVEPTPSSAQATTLVDVTPPTSTVNPLPAETTSTSFTVSVTGSDPTTAGGTPSGVASYAIYDSTDGGAFALFTTVPASNPTATFTAQAGNTYGFYSVATDNAGNIQATPASAQTTVQILPPLKIASVSSVTPNPRNTAVSAIDVSLSAPINPGSFTTSALTLTDNGGPNLITSAVTLTFVSGSTYQIGGLAGLTKSDGGYVLTVDAADIQDTYGNPGIGTVWTSWLMDTTPPISRVKPLPVRGTSLSFTVSVAGSDPNGPNNSPPSGVASYDVYASINGGAWKLWTNVPASAPSAIYTGQSNTTYTFYSIAHDLAGNLEVKTPLIEASTYLPDLTPPVTSVDGTSGTNPSTVDPSLGTFALDLTGSDEGGSGLAYFEVFTSVDSGTYAMVGPAIPAGPPDGTGNVHATIPYQGLTDGSTHTYSFFSIGIDGAGNVQSTPATPNLALTETFQNATPTQLQVTRLVVENGAVERSYVRYVEVSFNESDSQSSGELTQIVNSVGSASPEIQLSKYDLNGDASSKTPVSLSGVTVEMIDHAIELDFGATGIGGNPNTTAADGYYEVDIKLPSGQTAVHHFYRLLGDVTGDGIVDQNDVNEIAASIGETSPTGWTPLNADVTGTGTVTAFDLTLATRSKGRKLGSGLSLG
ncbi:MAG: Ig-like domain-containing protein [Isosphaerales bacterium]